MPEDMRAEYEAEMKERRAILRDMEAAKSGEPPAGAV
jgi:hypothetical protein